MKKILLTTVAAATLISATSTMAQDHSTMNMSVGHHSDHESVSLAPIGVTGDHLHAKGDWMIGYSFMNMEMKGNRNGLTDDLTPEEVITFNNPHAGPANLRVVPTEMTMKMHMLGGMYGLTDDLTLMVMATVHDNSMNHTTFNMPGTARIGTFTTNSTGLGDTQVAGMFSILDDENHTLNGRIGVSLPTGSIDEVDDVLTPMNTTPTLRLPYAMQLGSGTYDFMPGLTYTYGHGDWSFGSAYGGRIHMGRNNEGYTRGDWHELNSWVGYKASETLGFSANIKGKTEEMIKGQDTDITAPVQTADPENYGGQKIHLGLNAGYKFLEENTVKASFFVPVYQNLNGPQLEDDYSFAVRFERNF
ncbi:MAG: alpha-amylase [Alphaproteobacteria bacterium]|nr:MAG: alpha-amylase [Alphaproteobacteria bacterium]